MIAIIRVREDGVSRHLCDLDLMKFSEEQVRERMRERGVDDDAFFICGFRDWELDRILSLEDAYKLKEQIIHLYDGDDYLIRFMLKQGKPLEQIFTIYYKFYSKDELEVMKMLLKHADPELLLEAFRKSTSWSAFVMSYHYAGNLLVTPKGYYLAGVYFN